MNRFEVGQRVEITARPLEGRTGIVMKKRSKFGLYKIWADERVLGKRILRARPSEMREVVYNAKTDTSSYPGM